MENFVKNILDVSITASYLAAAVVVLRLLLKKAPRFWTVLLWGLVALRLIIPTLPESNLSLIPDTAPITGSFTEQENTYVPPTSPTPPAEDAVGNENETVPTPPVSTPDKPIQTEKAQGPWTIVFWVWGAGACLMLCYAFISWFKIYRTVKGAAHTEGKIYSSRNTATPFILGVIRPKIYLPEGLSEEEKEYVITHERAHLKRGDHLWKPLGFLLLSIHWFNPLLWVAYVLLCRDIEIAADEKAIVALGEEHKKPYSHALISCSANRALIAACPLAFGEVGVKDRVKRVLNYKRPAFWIIIVSVIALIATSVFFLTDPKEKPDLIGTWYGSNINSVGKSFEFKDDGSGIFNGESVYFWFKWSASDGKLNIEKTGKTSPESSPTPSSYVFTFKGEELVLITGDGENSKEYYSKTDHRYGGRNRLVTNKDHAYINWKNEDGSIHINFENIGKVTGKFNGKTLNNLYCAKDELLEIYLDGKTKTYRYTLEENTLTLTAKGQTIVLTAEFPNYTGHSVVGTWYGTGIKNAGNIYRFDEYGEGGFTTGFSAGTFNWIEKNGVIISSGLFYQNTPDGAHMDGGFSNRKIEYEAKDGVMYLNGLPYSKTKPDFGGDEAFVNTREQFPQEPIGFMESDEWKKRYIFHENGSLEIWTYDTPPIKYEDYSATGTLPPAIEHFAWRTNAEKNVLYIIGESGETAYNYAFTADGISLNSKSGDGFVLKEVVYEEESPTSGDGNWMLKGNTLTVSGNGEMTAPPDWAVNNKNVEVIIINEGITSIRDGAFNGYSALYSVTLPNSLQEIGSGAFNYCTSLTSITFPPNVQRVALSVFNGCTNLQRIDLPDNLNHFSSASTEVTYLETNLPALTTITISENNEKFYTEDGVLYEKVPNYPLVIDSGDANDSEGYYLDFLFFPKGKQGTYRVPKNVATWDTEVFHNRTGITSVDITENDGISRLYEDMFWGCSALKEVRISKRITTLEAGIFTGCTSFDTLYYDGTLEQWNAVNKKIDWHSGNVKRVVCTDGTCSVDGMGPGQ